MRPSAWWSNSSWYPDNVAMFKSNVTGGMYLREGKSCRQGALNGSYTSGKGLECIW